MYPELTMVFFLSVWLITLKEALCPIQTSFKPVNQPQTVQACFIISCTMLYYLLSSYPSRCWDAVQCTYADQRSSPIKPKFPQLGDSFPASFYNIEIEKDSHSEQSLQFFLSVQGPRSCWPTERREKNQL